MSSIESVKELSDSRRQSYIGEEEKGFKNKDLCFHHEDIVADRILFLPLFQEATSGVLDKYIDKKTVKGILEVGCGTGFFSRYLAPPWFKEKLVSFDISPSSLQILREKDKKTNIFQGSIYSLPIKSESLDVVIGYSSFDSFIWLSGAIQETKRALKPGGKIILFQDLMTELYEIDGTIEDKINSFEHYHEALINEVKKAGLNILDGENEYLEMINKESAEELKLRVPDFENMSLSLFGFWINGYRSATTNRIIKEAGTTKVEMKKRMGELSNNLRNKELYRKIKLESGELASFLSMRFLVCEKE